MGADKRCAASEWTLQVESAAKQNTIAKTLQKYTCKNIAKSRLMHAQKTVWGNEFATGCIVEFEKDLILASFF